MKDVRNKIKTTKQEVKEFRKSLERDSDKRMAWVLVIELITYIDNNEEKLLAKTVEKIKKNAFLKEDENFMKRLDHLSKKDIQYLKQLKEKIKP